MVCVRVRWIIISLMTVNCEPWVRLLYHVVCLCMVFGSFLPIQRARMWWSCVVAIVERPFVTFRSIRSMQWCENGVGSFIRSVGRLLACLDGIVLLILCLIMCYCVCFFNCRTRCWREHSNAGRSATSASWREADRACRLALYQASNAWVAHHFRTRIATWVSQITVIGLPLSTIANDTYTRILLSHRLTCPM